MRINLFNIGYPKWKKNLEFPIIYEKKNKTNNVFVLILESIDQTVSCTKGT